MTNEKQSKLGLVGIFILLLLILIGFIINQSYVIIEAGTVGVEKRFGKAQTKVLSPGLHFVIPIQTQVIAMNTKIQKVETNAEASSKDLQDITSTVVLNYKIEISKAIEIYNELKLEYQNIIIDPAIQESVKAVTADFTAEELITKRPEVKTKIYDDISKRLASYHIVVSDFSIINFSFSQEFTKAIEEKQIAEQKALRATNDLARIKTEALQEIAKAEGIASAKLEIAKAESEAQKLLKITVDENIIKLKSLDKWDGTLPMVMGDSSGSFFDVIGALKAKQLKNRGQ